MRTLVTVLLAVLAAVVAGVLLPYEPGYVMIAYGTTRVEFTLFVFLLIYIGVLLLGALCWWLTARVLGSPRRWRRHRGARVERRAAQRYTQGIVALAQGKMQVAERALEQAAQGVLALPALLGAARAADQAGASERRDAYLQRAADSDPRATPAVLATQAQLDLAHGDYERALAALQSLRREGGRHPQAERDLARVYCALGEPEKLMNLLPSLVRQTGMNPQEMEGWAATALAGVIARGHDKPAAVLRRLPAQLRELPRVSRALASAAVSAEPETAARVLEHSLKHGYDAGNVAAYAGLTTVPAAERLRTIEAWLVRFGEKDALLKAAGRVALEAELWGRARGYLAKLQTRSPDPETALLLGRVAEQEGREADARLAYRKGLELAAGPPPLNDDRD